MELVATRAAAGGNAMERGTEEGDFGSRPMAAPPTTSDLGARSTHE